MNQILGNNNYNQNQNLNEQNLNNQIPHNPILGNVNYNNFNNNPENTNYTNYIQQNYMNNQNTERREYNLIDYQATNSRAYNIRSRDKNYTKADIVNIIRVFAVIVIVLSIVVAGKSIYAITQKNDTPKDNPIVETEQMGKEVTVTINTQYPIKEFYYKWNEGQKTVVEGNKKVTISKVIDIPVGNNVLKIEVIDYNGHITQYQKQYIYQSNDQEKPKIQLGRSGAKLVITATDNVKMSYVTYKWNDDAEVRVENESTNEKEIKVDIDVPKGQNNLSIIAVDGESNKEIDNEIIIGDTKPTFNISALGSDFVINAQDDEGIKTISVIVDEANPIESTDINQKEITASFPLSDLEDGDHKIKVTVTNINGLSDTQEITITK